METNFGIKEKGDKYIVSFKYDNVIVSRIIEHKEYYKLYMDELGGEFDIKKDTIFGKDIRKIMRLKKLRKLNKN